MKDLIISCHAAKLGMTWKKRKASRSLRCPQCGSITPDDFINAILSLELVSGWHLDGDDAPAYCKLSHDRVFRHEHFLDMPVDWMVENAPLIHASTGILFYWKGERMHFRYIGIAKGKVLSKGQLVSEQDMDKAFKFMTDVYEGQL
jgi:hypothetical protein